ncbi:MAG: lytic transglycosylase domain-containing protein [Thiovulaceae bacterium]|nr:lytic transglycosylase domain-containing protein [Sulfurimonadaceae bacterium]
MNLRGKKILKESSASCLALSLTPSRAAGFTPNQRKKLSKKLKDESPYVSNWLNFMDGKYNVSTRFFKYGETFLHLYTRSGSRFRRLHFNVTLSNSFLDKLSKEDDFEKFVEITALDKNLKKVQKSLLKFDSTHTQSTLARFYIALIKIMANKSKKALADLDYVAANDFFQLERDKAIFWKYLITNEPSLLQTLYRSTDLNIYTLYAAEKLGKEPLGIYRPNFKQTNPLAVRENDPFVWTQILVQSQDATPQEACEILPNFESKNNLSIYSFFLERCSNYALHPYIMPYAKETKKMKVSKKAFLYALARQESRLIAGGLSHVYAQGMMQIMPFVSKAIAKQKRQKIQPQTMFDVSKNISYAKHHLKHLYRKLKHPLLIAYGYNQGIGSLRRNILKKGYFKNRFKYDPFLSMELHPFAETRNYGKKVLANYVVYSKLLGESISIRSLFESLK